MGSKGIDSVTDEEHRGIRLTKHLSFGVLEVNSRNRFTALDSLILETVGRSLGPYSEVTVVCTLFIVFAVFVFL